MKLANGNWELRLGDCLSPDTGLATLASRFAAKWIAEPNSGCWIWTAAGNENGYGHIGFRRRVEKAHRAAWLLFHGPIPDGMDVLHRCDTPPCVNPDHLFLGSNVDNVRDKVSKGRQAGAPGGRNGRAKLTDELVATLRARVRAGETASSVGRSLGVSVSTACRIVRGELWN